MDNEIKYPQINVYGLVTCDRLDYCLCVQCVALSLFWFAMVQAAALLFHTIKGCCWLVHNGMKCAGVLMSNSSSKGLLIETRLPVGWPDRWLGSGLDAGPNKREWYKSVSMIWLILPIHQLGVAQKWYRKQPLIDVYYYYYSLCCACTLDAESSFDMLLGWQACNLFWQFKTM